MKDIDRLPLTTESSSLALLRAQEGYPHPAKLETSPIDRLIPVQQGFRLLAMRPTKGYGEIAKGNLKVVKNGSRTFVRASEIQRYIDALEAKSQQAA